MVLLMDDGTEDTHQHFDYERIVEHQNLSKKKRKKLLKKGAELLDNDHFQVRLPVHFLRLRRGTGSC